MKTLLVVNSSSRATRSVTRQLSARFADKWSAANPDGNIVRREVGLQPPPPVDEAWIAAACAPPSEDLPAESLRISNSLIDEIIQADVIVLGVPMYNFGMPAQMKAYFDQIVRMGRTFAFDPAAENPYQPLLESKPVIAILSAGDGSLHIGGELERMNFLEPHLATILGFIGLGDFTPIRAGYDEYQDDRTKRSMADAEAAVDDALQNLIL